MRENVIREIRPVEIPLLNDFLYEAIFIPEGVPAPSRSVIEQEDLQVYVREMLQLLRRDGYQQVSLSVQKANYAFRMYQKAGFEVLKETGEEYLMVCTIKNQ